jgi:hypothetical protein
MAYPLASQDFPQKLCARESRALMWLGNLG